MAHIRRVVTSLAVCAAVAGVPAAALAWAAGTHAYIAKHTDKKAGQVDANELCNRIYGANATDLFNTTFTTNGRILADAMHDRDRLVPLLPWNLAQAGSDRARAFAFGMASHNDTWGTDSIAHYSGITYGRGEGYVVAKALIVRDELKALLPPELGFTDGQLLTVAHTLVEYGIDVLVAGADPTVSADLMAATACWRPEGELPAQVALLLAALVPALAADVGGPDQAMQEIVNALPTFMGDMGGSGYVLGLPPDEAVAMFAEATAYRAEAFLGLPPGSLEPIRPQLEAVASYGIWRGVQLCAPDFMAELEATIGRVNGRMSAQRISP